MSTLTTIGRGFGTTVLAILVLVSTLGMVECAIARRYYPGHCMASPSPWDQFCRWVESGRSFSLAERIESRDQHRLVWLAVALTGSGGLLVRSIIIRRSSWLRPSVRNLMVAVAVGPLAWVGGHHVWRAWDWFGENAMRADHYGFVASLYEKPEPGETATEAQNRQAKVVRFLAERQNYLHAMWRPWLDDRTDEPSETTP